MFGSGSAKHLHSQEANDQTIFLNQMGNNLDAYRAVIGLFHAWKMSLNIGYDSHSDTFHDILITNLRCSFLFASLLILQSLNPKVNVAFILFVLHFIL